MAFVAPGMSDGRVEERESRTAAAGMTRRRRDETDEENMQPVYGDGVLIGLRGRS